MWFWLAVIIFVVAYVAADACFDVSRKISMWWRKTAKPFLGRMWNKVAGERPKAAPAPVASPAEASAAPAPNLAKGRSGFDWSKAHWYAIAAVGLLLVLNMQGCTPPWGKSRDTLRAELQNSEAETETQETINERNAEIHAIRQDMALIRQDLRNISQRGRNALAAATPANEAPLDPGLVAAWRTTLDELCVERADRSRSDTCRP